MEKRRWERNGFNTFQVYNFTLLFFIALIPTYIIHYSTEKKPFII